MTEHMAPPDAGRIAFAACGLIFSLLCFALGIVWLKRWEWLESLERRKTADELIECGWLFIGTIHFLFFGVVGPILFGGYLYLLLTWEG